MRQPSLDVIHERLLDSMTFIQAESKNFNDVRRVACLVILEEDIEELLFEIKPLLAKVSTSEEALSDFLERSVTVLEEVEALKSESRRSVVVLSSTSRSRGAASSANRS